MQMVFRIVLIFLMLMPVGVCAKTQTLTGGIVYTVESVREIAFRNIEYEISMEPYKEYMRDPGFVAGEGGKRPKVSTRGRYITWFSDGTYGVGYYNKPEIGFYYSAMGKLESIELGNRFKDYPYLSKSYDLKGRLLQVGYHIDARELYVYSPDKRLEGHWVKNNYYDEYGNKIIKRK